MKVEERENEVVVTMNHQEIMRALARYVGVVDGISFSRMRPEVEIHDLKGSLSVKMVGLRSSYE